MIAEHSGFVEKRTWHKIRWTFGTNAGKFDLFTEEDLGENRDSVEIVETFRTDKCATGAAFGFGRSAEDQIDDWIRRNRRV